MPKEDRNKLLDIFTLGDLIDRAIVFLTEDNRISTLSLQKGIFLYLYSYAVTNGYDFNKVLESAAFEPFRFGPFSDAVAGQVDTLIGYGVLKGEGTGESRTFIGIPRSSKKYNFEKDESRLLMNIKNLVDILEPLELTFYIYFNPLINSSLREYFTSKSEIKDRLANNKESYVKSLMKKGVIDQSTADLIMYGGSQS